MLLITLAFGGALHGLTGLPLPLLLLLLLIVAVHGRNDDERK